MKTLGRKLKTAKTVHSDVRRERVTEAIAEGSERAPSAPNELSAAGALLSQAN